MHTCITHTCINVYTHTSMYKAQDLFPPSKNHLQRKGFFPIVIFLLKLELQTPQAFEARDGVGTRTDLRPRFTPPTPPVRGSLSSPARWASNFTAGSWPVWPTLPGPQLLQPGGLRGRKETAPHPQRGPPAPRQRLTSPPAKLLLFTATGSGGRKTERARLRETSEVLGTRSEDSRGAPRRAWRRMARGDPCPGSPHSPGMRSRRAGRRRGRAGGSAAGGRGPGGTRSRRGPACRPPRPGGPHQRPGEHPESAREAAAQPRPGALIQALFPSPFSSPMRSWRPSSPILRGPTIRSGSPRAGLTTGSPARHDVRRGSVPYLSSPGLNRSPSPPSPPRSAITEGRVHPPADPTPPIGQKDRQSRAREAELAKASEMIGAAFYQSSRWRGICLTIGQTARRL